MKIAFNPSTVAALTTPPNNKDITFDLRGRNIFARGVKFYGTDTNTWRDIKINNVSIGSYTLDLRNGSNTTLTNTNGVVTINSTWRPVVDNLTSDSTTSSLSAKQGKVLKALIDSKSNSDHNHDGRYLRLSGQDTMQGNLYLHSYGTSYIGKGLGDKSGADFTEANIVIRSQWGISFKSYDDIVRTYIDTKTGNIGTKGVLNAVGAVIQGRVYNGGDDEGIIINPASNGYAGLILGTHNGERSVFYLTKGNPFWRYNNGSTNLDIQHPKKPGVIALTSDIPTSLKNPYSFNVFGVVYDGSAAKTVTTPNFVSQLTESTSTVTDGTMFITSWASNSGFADPIAVNYPYKRKAIHLWEYIKAKTDSLYATEGHNHDGRYVRAFGTSNDNINSDWGQSFKTFDPIPSGTPPEQNPNISILNIGEDFNRRKQLAFIWNNDNIYYRRHTNSGFTNWRRLAFANEIPTNYYWANVKISASSSTTTSPTFSNVYLGNSLYLNNRGLNSIYNGPNDSANGVGGPLNNLVFSSWWGVSFTTSCAEYTYTNKNAVSIDCRTGQLYAREVQADGFHHASVNSDNYMLLAGGGYKSFGGDDSTPIFLGCLDLYHGKDDTISSSFYCLGYSVPFTYTRGGNYCKIIIPDTARLAFYVTAAIASVNYSGGGMDTWVGDHRGQGAWWLHCQTYGWNEVRVKGFHPANVHNDSWWGGNPLYADNGGANKITVCIFGHVKYK